MIVTDHHLPGDRLPADCTIVNPQCGSVDYPGINLAGVVLISPDIDIDVFRAQARAIPKLPQPFVVFTSERDRILRLSARLSGQTDRLGTLTDVTRVADLPITFLDVAAFNRGSGHFNVGNSPALLRLLERIASVDQALIGLCVVIVSIWHGSPSACSRMLAAKNIPPRLRLPKTIPHPGKA